MMCKTAAQLTRQSSFFYFHSNFSPALAQRLNVLLLVLSAALLTTSCGTAAQAAGAADSKAPHTLSLSGSLPPGTVSQSYNAVLAVSGGNSPYHFSVKNGALPAGLTLNARTGSFSGQPTSAGNYSFEVIVTDSPLLDEGIQMFSISVGGGSGGGNVKVSVSPSSATLTSGLKQQFTATVSGTSNTAVTWSATAGTIDTNGLYAAPTVTSPTNVTVTATSQADKTKSANSAVTVDPVNQQALKITTGGLPQGQQGSTYSEVLSATGGSTPYNWSISAGTPPSGIAMNPNGDFAGMPNTAGTFNFTVMVTDAASKTATANFSVTVVAGGNFDGPAELPRVTVPSAMSDTPAPGSVISVNAGGDLQAAMNSAHCGDTIQLQAGATFSGKFTVPAKNCDINHWIIIRTSSPDNALPPEGQRATPCYAGVSSLDGRPQYSCNNPKNVMAKVQMTIHDDGPFQFANGANFYRFIGLEVTRPVGTPGGAVLFSAQGTADHLVFDRMWLHGQAQDETHNGVSLGGTTNVAVVDSYFNDFKCIAGTGKCTDAHAISGGVSNTQDGPYKIQNNFLEASGEGVMFGGGAATMTPTDITIVNNHFWKPWQWMKGNNPFVGGPDGHPFIVKNHLEMKNAVRVLVEANLMENSWGGFSQTGYGILLTPKNQHTPSGSNVCPICQVTDVTIRYTHISHGGAGIQMATVLSGSGSGGAPALAGTRWSIHDVVIDDLNKKYVGGGTAFEIMNDWPANPLNTITINHVTAFPDPGSHVMITGNVYQNAPMYALVFTNNLVITGQYPVWNTGGGPASCAYKDVPVTTINTCFTSYTFGNNGLIATPPKFPPSSWPTNNMFPTSVDSVAFVNFNNGNGGNYELQSNSPYKGKGTDGKDLGADIVGLNEALANVE
ncbi:MAG: putative Ig domain-containing protein [Acidobacteriia bacterium]|nr:putative Ig domain-containing protein [Terriglobia bacterium]